MLQSDQPGPLAQSLSRALAQPDNTLVLHSSGLSILRPLAHALLSCQSFLTLLIDFPPLQLQQLNYHLLTLRQQLVLSGSPPPNAEAVSLHKLPREKRRKMYMSGGIYALSTQIYLLDCLSESPEVEVRLITRLYIREGEHVVADRHSLLCWLATITMQIGCTMVVVSNKASRYRGEQLQSKIRLMYIKKLALWPYGRSQIHQCLQSTPLVNRNHKLTLNPTQNHLHSLYLQLLKASTPHDQEQIIHLCRVLLNDSTLGHLERVYKVMQGASEWGVWNSNVMGVMEAVDGVMRGSRAGVWGLGLAEGRGVGLGGLIGGTREGVGREKEEERGEQGEKGDKEQKQQPEDSQPHTHNPGMYQLTYELHVPGLQHDNIHTHPLFPAKLLHIINQITTNFRMQAEEGRMEEMQEAEEMNFVMSCVLGNGEGGRQEDKKEKGEEGGKGQKGQKGEKEGEQITEEVQEEDDKGLQKEEEEEKKDKEVEQGKSQQAFDTTKYEFVPRFKIEPALIPQPEPKQSLISQPPSLSQPAMLPTPSITPAPTFTPGSYCAIVAICTPSTSLTKQLHYLLHCYQHNLHYTAYIQRLHLFLQLTKQARVTQLSRLLKRQTSKSLHPKKTLIEENEPVLLQELYLEVRTVSQLIDQYTLPTYEAKQRGELFCKQLARHHFRHIDKTKVILPEAVYNPLDDCILTLDTRRGLRVRVCLQTTDSIPQLNLNLRYLAPSQLFFYTPNTNYIRHLNVQCSQGQMPGLARVHAVYFADSIESDRVVKAVKEEDEAFWSIAQERKKLGEFVENAMVRVQELVLEDEIEKRARMMRMAVERHGAGEREKVEGLAVERTVLVDKREFKSLLPSYLYHYGFKIIPLFLQNADYIISNDVGIEKKSVQTRDLHQSLKSGRLADQLRRLSSKFAKPYLLIECPDISHFRRQQFCYASNKVTGQRYSLNIRKQLIQLLCKYPKVNVLWSTSYDHTVKMIKELKRNQENAEVGRFRPQTEEEPEIGDEGERKGEGGSGELE